eukprot:TRINITY_DN43385_c0_g1_i1.p1 TRINITY_DN43385_c0_g1~~TRINITY_DN43385_c0_g1_i1.p1  ORF type:complete len:305 (-),score=77.68 TRINITY_DN43385_c0_g1_i1:198-1016(-)
MLRSLVGSEMCIRDRMFRTMMAWRKSADIDAIRNDIVNRNLCQRTLPGYQEFTEAFPVRFFFGQDKEGNPVCRDMLGQFNPKECSLSEDNLQRFWIYHLEFRMLLLDRLSREHNRMMLVYEIKDLEGVGLGQLWSCKPVLQKLAKINTTYYVETTRRVAVINLPGIFQALYTAAKPFIPERSKAKIKIIDESDQNEIVISEDMCLDSFHATEPVFDARPTPPVVIPAGTFKTPPGTPPHVKCNRTDLDVNEFRKAMVDLGIVYAEDLESRYQ